MIEALRAVRYGVTDLALASRWYSQLLDLEPYLSNDTLVRYFVDGSWLELKLESPSEYGGIVAFWGVDNLNAELLRLHQTGVLPHAPPALVDAITQIAIFFDPFGNAVGFMEVHDAGVLRARGPAAHGESLCAGFVAGRFAGGDGSRHLRAIASQDRSAH